MYDNIKLWCFSNDSRNVVQCLDDVRETLNKETGEVKDSGSCNGLSVSVSGGRVSIVGSLAKFHNNSNVYSLDRASTKDALSNLSDRLHLQMDDAKVVSLEFGTAFLMKEKVSDYLAMFGNKGRFEKNSFKPHSIYYQGISKQPEKAFVFYDKIKDANSKGMDYPQEFENANLLRYEMRYKRRLKQQLGQNVQASTLYDRGFYKYLVAMYQKEYFSISKKRQLTRNAISGINSVSDAFDVLFSRLYKANEKDAQNYLEELKQSRVLDRAKTYRLRKRINETLTKEGTTEQSDLIKELDNDIKNVGAYV